MIDAHIHVVPPQLPGAGALSPLLEGPGPALAEALRRELQTAGGTHALAMGHLNGGPDDPLGVASTLAVARAVPGLHVIGVADPRRSEPEHLRAAEAQLAGGRVKGLKGYLGYLHFGPEHPGYRPYYELAERHNVPVVFHTGDTYSPRAKLRYAQPLLVDEVAVDHPRVRFVLAHLGNPWLLDAAEVVYKNVNVWADLSGLAVGSAEDLTAPERAEALEEVVAGVRRAFRYAERPNRFLYGSDWPLAPLAPYKALIAAAIPEMYHPQIFEDNARALFRL
jgi:predicted TIM-barrel fold metal-dependent hydrolase